MAGRALTIEDAAAARAVVAIVAHAAAQRDGAVSIRAEEGTLVVASPGETSLLMARLPFEGDPEATDGTYAPPDQPPAVGDAGSLSVRGVRGRLQIAAGKLRLTLDRLSDEAVDVAWVWPATAPSVEALVSRDGLLDALPSGEGRLSFSGADKQVVLQAGRDERRLSLKNRTRRRKDIGTAVAFDQLRSLVEAAAADVTLGLGDLRPLTIESGPVRGMLVRGAPMRWRSTETAVPATRRAAATPTSRPQPAADDSKAEERRRREAERRAREREQEARRRARSATAAVAAVGRAISQVDAATDDAEQLGDERARDRLAEARIALDAAAASLRRHLDS